MENAKFYCGRCRMNFTISRPRAYNDGRGHEVTHCAEPDCGQRFWHTVNAHVVPPVRIGIFPEDVPLANFTPRGLVP